MEKRLFQNSTIRLCVVCRGFFTYSDGAGLTLPQIMSFSSLHYLENIVPFLRAERLMMISGTEGRHRMLQATICLVNLRLENRTFATEFFLSGKGKL